MSAHKVSTKHGYVVVWKEGYDIMPLRCFGDYQSAAIEFCKILNNEHWERKYQHIQTWAKSFNPEDKNIYLIWMWSALVSGFRFNTVITKEYYDEVRRSYRNRDGKFTAAEIGWVGFMGSYNGRFFDGGYSGHHVRTAGGGERDYIGENIANTMRQVESLRGVEFIGRSYDNNELISHIPPESIIYCDPPYNGTKRYSSSINFNHDSFWQWCRLRVREGHRVFVSEQSAPDDFVCVWEKPMSRTINHSVTRHTTERLFVHNEQNV